ncbi:MAG: endonuclease/exonuclease/phosphatase family protein [Ilumatobacteraceae bacterium]
MRLAVVVLAWCVVGVALALAVTQAAGWSRSMLVAVGQALTVVLGVLCLTAVIAGLLWSNWLLTVGALVAVAATAAVVAPAVRQRTPAGATGATATLSVLHANLLFENTGRDHEVAAALLGEGADVLALSELNPGHEGALVADRRAASYPYRCARPATNADGMAVWSRYPLADVEWLTTDMRPTVVATVCLPGAAEVRIVLAHNNPPTTRAGLRNWEPSMVAIHGAATTPGPPTMIVADLNASRSAPAVSPAPGPRLARRPRCRWPWPERVVAGEGPVPVPVRAPRSRPARRRPRPRRGPRRRRARQRSPRLRRHRGPGVALLTHDRAVGAVVSVKFRSRRTIAPRPISEAAAPPTGRRTPCRGARRRSSRRRSSR